TLPRMLADFQAGRLGGVCRAEGRLHIASARRDLLARRDYLVGNAVQVSGGCPHRCRFCTTRVMYGGRYAWRPVEEIVREVRQLGSKWGIFADDNIFGNRGLSRGLFRAMADLRVGFGYYFRRQKRRIPDFDRAEDWRPELAAAAPA
ncbi:MAG: radical SAM protein, partial [Desulfosalsimonas sp.]